MSLALLFPGQGSQFVGMGKALFAASAAARAVFEEADAALDFPLSRIGFERLEGAVFAAGHSLGEYSAEVAAGALAFADAARLVRRRGLLMQQAVPPGA